MFHFKPLFILKRLNYQLQLFFLFKHLLGLLILFLGCISKVLSYRIILVFIFSPTLAVIIHPIGIDVNIKMMFIKNRRQQGAERRCG
jgi:hypothetical protein